MIINFLLSLIPICLGSVVAILTGGGTITNILDIISFGGIIVLFVAALLISGYGKAFCRIFSSNKKFKTLDLQELQQTDLALKFGSKILFYTAILIPILVLIYTLCNYYNDAETYTHLGPNYAVLLLSVLYLSLLEMIIVSLKAKTRKHVIMYMADEENQSIKSNLDSKSLVKMIFGIILFIAICIIYGYISGLYAWGKNSLISTIIDMPSITIIILYVLPLIAISGNFMILFRSIKTTFTGRKINVTEKNLCLNALKTTIKLNWYGAFSGAVCGWIAMLCHLEDTSSLTVNLSVSLIPLFYAACLNLFMLFVEIRITKAAE